MNKTCRTCGETQSYSEFSKGRAVCKSCRNEQMKLYYLENRDDAISRASEWAKSNPERKREINKKSNIKIHGVPVVQPMISEELKETVRCFFRDLDVALDENERREVCLKYLDYTVFRMNTVPEKVEEQFVKYLEG